MESSVEIQQKGTGAVKKLRLQKLQNGIPFMINSKELPGNQCYMEYPDTSIKLVTISGSGLEFIVLRILTENECNELRQKYNLTNA